MTLTSPSSDERASGGVRAFIPPSGGSLHKNGSAAKRTSSGSHPEGSSCLHRTTCSMPIQLITAMPENRSPCHDSPASLMLIYDRFPALDAPLKSVRYQLP